MIDVICMIYNEEKLLPFFLQHYSFADKIYVIIDADTTDRSEEICKKYENVSITYYKFQDKFSTELACKERNRIASLCEDWIINVDADEFIFHKQWKNLADFLYKAVVGNTVVVSFYEVFRNRNDNDLDYSKPAVPQRRHGSLDIGQSYGFKGFNKPIVARREVNPVWGIGQHELRGNIAMNPERLYGAHWCMADPELAIERRIKGWKNRMSSHDIFMGYGEQHYHITEDLIRKKCNEMLDAPRLF